MNCLYKPGRPITVPRHEQTQARIRSALLWIAPKITDDPTAGEVQAICPNCHRNSRIVAKRHRQWFTIFFIPIFPVSRTKRISECSLCGTQFPVPLDEFSTRVDAADREQSQRAIAMYNSLRNSPANSVTLNELMALYASMGEFDQAISAAGTFPQALHNSEQCLVTLGRVYLAKNQHADAMQWLGAAVQKNPHLAEGQYYLAVACLTVDPPQYEKAIAAARLARVEGYPGADELLREAEARNRA